MGKLEYEFSRFPEALYTKHNFKNVLEAPPEVYAAIMLIKDAIQSGNYDKASRLLSENKALITDYWIDADTINAIEEEIHNLETYAKTVSQSHYYCEEEPNCIEGDVWIG